MRSPIGSDGQGRCGASSTIADPWPFAGPRVLVPDRQLRLGRFVTTARLLEVLGRGRDRAMLVDRLQHDALPLEQVQRRLRALLAAERVEPEVTVAAQGLESPGTGVRI